MINHHMTKVATPGELPGSNGPAPSQRELGISAKWTKSTKAQFILIITSLPNYKTEKLFDKYDFGGIHIMGRI